MKTMLVTKNGFTMIQLMIVLSIVAVLLLIGIPNFTSTIKSHKIKAAAEHFYSDMNLVRSEALKNSQEMHVNLNPTTDWCYGANDAECSCGGDTCSFLKETNAEYGNVAMTLGIGSAQNFTFNGIDGTINTNSEEVNFEIDEKSIIVRISATGRITICSDTLPGYPVC